MTRIPRLLLLASLAGTRLAPAALAAASGRGEAPAALAGAAKPSFALPEDHGTLTRSTSWAGMASLLASLDGKGPVSVSVAGKSREGRDLFVVRLSHGGEPRWRLLFYAQQHGDEVSGKDALLYLVRDVARNPALLPAGVEVRILPMVNPDGAEAGTRRNAAGADLNRDHATLEEPETQALHRVVQAYRPHLAVDLHEFTRDGAEWRRRGFVKWPDVTMDGLCNPLFSEELVAAALRHVDEAGEAVTKAGHRYSRYFVGGVPPGDEQRPSAPDLDGALNAVGAYGALSFIVEAAVTRSAGDPAADLGKRVDAVLVLLRRFLSERARRPEDLEAIERARARPLPAFLPTNAFWANAGGRVSEFPVIEAATGRETRVATPNLMTTMVVKGSVPTPLAYAVTPEAAPVFRALLEHHGIPFEVLSSPRAATVERASLLRLEEDFDELYSRYEGRQVVRRQAATATELPAGSLVVPLEGEAALRAALLLEPTALYGLWQYPRFRELVGKGGELPVVRVVEGPAPAGPRSPVPLAEEPREKRLGGRTGAALIAGNSREGLLDVTAATGPGRFPALATANGMTHNYISISEWIRPVKPVSPGDDRTAVPGVQSCIVENNTRLHAWHDAYDAYGSRGGGRTKS
jgi:hypothetical protein